MSRIKSIGASLAAHLWANDRRRSCAVAVLLVAGSTMMLLPHSAIHLDAVVKCISGANTSPERDVTREIQSRKSGVIGTTTSSFDLCDSAGKTNRQLSESIHGQGPHSHRNVIASPTLSPDSQIPRSNRTRARQSCVTDFDERTIIPNSCGVRGLPRDSFGLVTFGALNFGMANPFSDDQWKNAERVLMWQAIVDSDFPRDLNRAAYCVSPPVDTSDTNFGAIIFSYDSIIPNAFASDLGARD